ncbi:MAG: hypothetical protein ABSH50_18970 [Bryobacteraceae bacterium]|jgi:hypothetical protein
MSRFQETNRVTQQPEIAPGAKKPYQKPAVRYERVFETSALTCGKVQTTQSGCHQNRKTS